MEEEALTGDALRIADIARGYQLRSKLHKITRALKLFEKISVIFLLCDSPSTGAVLIEEILNENDTSTQNVIFYKWLKSVCESSTEGWRNGLAEMLTIIQNYKLAKILGFKKEYLIEKYMPKNNSVSFWVSGIRKVLYNLCEKLNSDESLALIEKTGDSVDCPKDRYLEYKLLKWSECGVINLGNEKPIDLVVLVENLRTITVSAVVHDIEVVVEKVNCASVRNKFLQKLESDMSEYYELIDENYLGLCVIINEKNFTSSLFPKRLGTDKDAERLIEVFTAFGFDVRIHVDLTFADLMSTLAGYAKTVDKASSFFVLIILSHGSENVIYTSDSLPVDMNMIEMIFQAELCPNLLGKPKIFIVQSCQGEQWQRVMLDTAPDLEADCALPANRHSTSIGPQRGDSMIAWSTVQGFASFRDKYNGSWYIQELCSQLWKFGDAMDLVEILTKVNNNLRSKVYGGQFMVPSLLLSLRAKVQFPSRKENFTKGKKMMLERLIFEKYFREFIMSNKSSHLDLVLNQL